MSNSAQYGIGLFEPNLRDERYLPFEFAGVISNWHVGLPQDYNCFNVDTISDVVIHLRYTARQRGEALRNARANYVRGTLSTQGLPVFDLHQQFVAAWQRFLQPAIANGVQELKIDLTNKDLFPYYV